MKKGDIKKQQFCLLGVAGFIAPRHLEAIKTNNGQLIAAMDPSDSVGILDKYFPEAKFFTSYERFERFLYLRKIEKTPVNYISICSPNYLHDTHCRLALSNNAHAICEKPLVLHLKNLERLQQAERETDKKIFCILQLRLHEKIKSLRDEVNKDKAGHYDIYLEYITSRGPWYDISWKGDEIKSGGILFNIGIHFFDMLINIFGEPQTIELSSLSDHSATGRIKTRKANIRWKLSTSKEHLPEGWNKPTFREIKINGQSLEFSDGFTELHNASYKSILLGNGYGLNDVAPSLNLVSKLRSLGAVSESKISSFNN